MFNNNRPKFSALSLVLLCGLTSVLVAGCSTPKCADSGFLVGYNCVYPRPLPPPTIVTITPSSVTLAAGGSAQFSATVANQKDQNVIWEVNTTIGGNSALGTITSNGFYTAPKNLVTPLSVQIGAIPEANTGSFLYDGGAVQVIAAHRIGVRPGSSFAEFFDRGTGASFTPRGNNYIRLASLTDANGNPLYAHSTFSVGLYDLNHAENALATMQVNGYNVVRVFLEGCCQNTFGDPAGGPSSAYIANVVDFLHRARAHGLAVMFTIQWLPAFGGYTANCPQFPQFEDANLRNLCPGGVAANVKFWQDFVKALIQKSAPIDAIFAYELTNEHYYNVSAAPLSWTSGTITTANGKTYDMGSAASRQQMMDDDLVYFNDQIRSAILALDPTALVTMGFFVPQGPNPTRFEDNRVIEVYPAMANSTADFVDLHAYPIPNDLTLAQIVQNYGFVGLGTQQQKPIIMAEFGGFTSEYATASAAASGLTNWQIQSCIYNFKGWLLWTWDTDEQPELWNGLSGGGAINLSLAPASRPNPCSP